jgi:phage shock protein C
MADQSSAPKRLYLSSTDKKLSGVCGGIAEYLGQDPTLIRLGWVVLTILTGGFLGIIGYIVAAAIIPNRPETGAA